jgi:8-oxo-dGTP pyrophosphatase MutT (NUDIX family)
MASRTLVVMSSDPYARLRQPPRFPKGRQQVAAVCYRMGKRDIEFLLVQTRSGRWIFPKGGVERGLTHAQSAALEAFEEAGVHGRMETVAFARYFTSRPEAAAAAPAKNKDKNKNKKKDKRGAAAVAPVESRVAAYLCEVSRLEPPQESNRHPTWFSAEKARQSLCKDRAPEFGAELARIVDRAVSRIQRLQANVRVAPDRMRRDGLQEARFEAYEEGRLPDDLRKTLLARYILRHGGASSAMIEAAVQAQLRKVAKFRAAEGFRQPVLRLSAGANSAAETARNVTAIDRGRRNLLKPGKLPPLKRRVAGKVVAGRMEKSWIE